MNLPTAHLRHPLRRALEMGVTALVALLGGPLAMAAPADDVKALLEQGKDKQAYEAGKAAPDALGEPLFDFYFGIAALNAGVPGEGVLALERYLLQFPENRSARFQLARGYFIVGEDQRAREEFASLATDATGNELDNINQFLDAIRARESRYKPTSSAFVELGGGYDTNINSGVRSGQVDGLPAGFVIAPGQSSEKQADFFSSVAAGLQGIYPVAPGVAVYGGGLVSGRFHAAGQSNVFDQATFGLQGGISVIDGRNLFRTGIDLTHIAVANQAYLDVTTLVGEWQYQQDQFNRYGLSAQWSSLGYKNVDTYLDLAKTSRASSGATVRDSDLHNLGASWTRTLQMPSNPLLSTHLSVGRENNRKGRPDLSRDLWGVRASISFDPVARWTLAAGLSYQNSQYRGDFTTGVSARRDRYHALDLSVAYAIDRQWILRTEYQRVDQRSNIGFYTYTRDALVMKLRYDFR